MGTDLFVVGVSIYLTGLLGWLAIGLLPTLARDSAAVHKWVTDVASRGGIWRPYAQRVLHPPMTMEVTASGSTVAAEYLFSLLNLALGLILVIRLRTLRVPRLLAFALLGTAATFNHPSHQVFDIVGQPPVVKALHFAFHIISGVTYLWAVVLFPDGSLPASLRLSGRKLPVAVAAVTAAMAVVCWRSSFLAHPQFFVVFFGVLVPAVGIPMQTLRIRSSVSVEERQQARLLRGALLPALVTAVGWLGAWVVAHAVTAATSKATAVDHWLAAAFPAVFAVVPIMLLFGVLRYRLWDLDTFMSRTLLYAGAIGLTGVAYVGLVTAAGAIAGYNAVTAVVAMAATGLVILPVYGSMHRLANRLAFGQTLEPAEALRALADGLEHLAPAGELQELARVVVDGTRATAARVWLHVDDHVMCVAASPVAGPDLSDRRVPPPGESSMEPWAAAVGAERCIPIYHHGDLLGVLGLSLPPGVDLPAAESRLVADLAGEAGLLVHNAQLSAELARHVDRLNAQAAELRKSRRRVVAATDAERRALERDLHDGAQQDLVALLLGLRALRSPPSAPELAALEELATSAGATVDELCRGVIPPALESGGLHAGLEAVVRATRTAGLEVTVAVDVPRRPPADVEVAVYFCCVEAIQNAVKHARCSSVMVDVCAVDGEVRFVVTDDGLGFTTAAANRSGLRHLTERLSVLGGDARVTSAPGRGTAVAGTVPVGEPK